MVRVLRMRTQHDRGIEKKIRNSSPKTTNELKKKNKSENTPLISNKFNVYKLSHDSTAPALLSKIPLMTQQVGILAENEVVENEMILRLCLTTTTQ